MTTSRRRFLAGAAVAATATSGCLDRSDGSGTAAKTANPTAVAEGPRVDEPPYEIETPPSDRDAWNDLYLCANMPSDSDLAFEEPDARQPDPLLSTHDLEDGDAYAVRALTSREEVQEVFDFNEGADDPDGPLEGIDFDEYLVLVVEDGFGSGSVSHHWTRVDATDSGLHLHGCLRLPYEQTDDLTARHSVLKVERPDEFAIARVSLTVGTDRRVNFNSTEGVVTVDRPS